MYHRSFFDLMERWTEQDENNLRRVQRSHYLESCPFVDLLLSGRPAGYLEPAREFRESPGWTEVSSYIGETCRYSILFKETFIGVLDENSVSGEFESRAHPQELSA